MHNILNQKSALEQILPLSGPHRLLVRAVQAATSTRQEKSKAALRGMEMDNDGRFEGVKFSKEK